MLVNAQDPQEVRIAVADGPNLESYQVELAERGQSKGNIYRGIIANIQPSLNAAFIDYGAERNGFLAIQDVVPEAYYRQPHGGRVRIEDVLERGKPIVVQVVKDPEGQKGAALTTNLSLAGRYLVLTPFDPTLGVSRKVEDDDVRRALREQVSKLEVPPGCGVIVRTNALDVTKTALARDLAALLRLWKRVETEARQGKGTRLLYSDQDVILQALRDYLDAAIEEVLIDDDAAFERAATYMRTFMPRSKVRIGRYAERAPIFSRFSLDLQIDRIYERTAELSSGGSIVIDRTEALVAIDVNSGRTGGANQAETALATNLEAAREVARQLRLRDLGGLIVVDFIDMRSPKARRQVEKALRDAMKVDKARFTVGKISENGLLEINRQRIHQALAVRTHRACPTCSGTGRIASPELVSLNLLRRIEAQAATGLLKKAKIALHPELADAFQNRRRRDIARLEEEFGIEIEVIASARLHRPDQEVEWIKRDPSERPPRAVTPVGEPQVQATYLDLSAEEEEEDLEEGEAEEAAADGEAGDEGGEGKGRRKRRRRGGRRRRREREREQRGERPADETGGAAPVAAGSDEEDDEAAEPVRRDAGNGRRVPAAEPAEPAEPGDDEEGDDEDGGSEEEGEGDAEATPGGEAAEGGTGSGSRRRRRRFRPRRRRRRRDGNGQGPGGGDAPAPGSSEG
jgi:ribonuclease E